MFYFFLIRIIQKSCTYEWVKITENLFIPFNIKYIVQQTVLQIDT